MADAGGFRRDRSLFVCWTAGERNCLAFCRIDRAHPAAAFVGLGLSSMPVQLRIARRGGEDRADVSPKKNTVRRHLSRYRSHEWVSSFYFREGLPETGPVHCPPGE